MHDIGPTMAASTSAMGPQSNHHGLPGVSMGPGQQYGGNSYVYPQQFMTHSHPYTATYAELQPMQMVYEAQAPAAPQVLQGRRMPGNTGTYSGHFEQQRLSPLQSFEEGMYI